jgi:hypothetical protein
VENHQDLPIDSEDCLFYALVCEREPLLLPPGPAGPARPATPSRPADAGGGGGGTPPTAAAAAAAIAAARYMSVYRGIHTHILCLV